MKKTLIALMIVGFASTLSFAAEAPVAAKKEAPVTVVETKTAPATETKTAPVVKKDMKVKRTRVGKWTKRTKKVQKEQVKQ